MLICKTLQVDVPDFGQRVKDARMASPLSLTEICAAAKMSVSNWYRVENNQVKALPFETLQNIEKALGVDFGIVL